MKIELYGIESQILRLLSETEGNILDNTTLIETLAEAKVRTRPARSNRRSIRCLARVRAKLADFDRVRCIGSIKIALLEDTRVVARTSSTLLLCGGSCLKTRFHISLTRRFSSEPDSIAR